MVTGFDIWSHDAGLRRHWRGRVIAFFLDAALTLVPTSATLYLMNITDITYVGLACSASFYIFSAAFESASGTSPGKWMLGFAVHHTESGPVGARAFVRNITRLLWFALPPLDFAFGMSMRGDPRQKLFDRMASAKVVHASETERHDAALKGVGELGHKSSRDSPAVPVESCNTCGGQTFRLPDGKLQCEKCGVIQ